MELEEGCPKISFIKIPSLKKVSRVSSAGKPERKTSSQSGTLWRSNFFSDGE
jgi:hypothetical protein